MRELLSTKQAWLWGPESEQAFGHVKDYTNDYSTVQAEFKISADASSFGLGSIRQRQLLTHGLCIPVNVRNRKEVRLNSKGNSLSGDMGM